MAESACLRRSYTLPSDSSSEVHHGDPMRALGESISLGRFMSESLAWEKWSTFSHNRYLEEVEKISRPGSVAERKAYFEAHYKKKAAERAAALLLEANGTQTISSKQQDRYIREAVDTSGVYKDDGEVKLDESSREQLYSDNREAVDIAGVNRDDSERELDESSTSKRSVLQHELHVEVSEQGICDIETNAMDSDKMETEAQMASVNKDDGEIKLVESITLKKGIESVLRHDPVVDVSKQDICDIERNEMDIDKMETEAQALPCGSTDLNLKNRSSVNDMKQSDGAEKHDNTVKLEELRNTNEAALGVKVEKEADSSATKLKTSIRVPKPSHSTSEQKLSMNSRVLTSGISKFKKPVADIVGKRRLTSKPLHISVDLSSHTSQRIENSSLGVKVKKEADSSVTRLKTSIRVPKPSHSTSEQKLYMNSRVLTSGISKFEKPVADIVGKRRLTSKSLHISVDLTSHTSQRIENSSLMPKQNSERKISIVPKRSPISSQNPTRVSVSGILKQPPSRPLSECRSSSSNATGSNTRPPIISFPFRFRSEERAAKRKEKLEEKNKRNEAEKKQFQTRSKEKAENDSKKLCQSSIFSYSLSDEANYRMESCSSKVKKIPLTRPQSPKLGRKSAFLSVQESSVRHSWRPSAIAASKSKAVPNHNLSTLLPKKFTHENASPNVQH